MDEITRLVTGRDVNDFVIRDTQERSQITDALQRFVEANLDPQVSPHLQSQKRQGDDLSHLFRLFQCLYRRLVLRLPAETSPAHSPLSSSRRSSSRSSSATSTRTLAPAPPVVPEVTPFSSDVDCLPLLVMQVIKILSRKLQNRLNMESSHIRLIIEWLRAASQDIRFCTEGASALLNICYERENVLEAIRWGAAEVLVRFLSSVDDDLVANAAGALQSICFQKEGKEALCKCPEGVEMLVKLLSTSTTGTPRKASVRARACGTLHNLSSDIASIPLIRTANAVGPLIECLRPSTVAMETPYVQHAMGEITHSAAGTVQNITREDQCCRQVIEAGGTPALAELLFCSDVATQTCAVGALMNLYSHARKTTANDDGTHRRSVMKLLTSSLVLGIVFHCLTD